MPGLFICLRCGYTYDPEQGDPQGGISPGTPGEDLPKDWRCPVCRADQGDFARREEDDDFV